VGNKEKNEENVKGKEKGEEKIYRITIRLPEKERQLAEKLANYLYEYKLIKKPSINEVIRYSIMYLGYVIAQQAKAEVGGGGANE